MLAVSLKNVHMFMEDNILSCVVTLSLLKLLIEKCVCDICVQNT